ncbi:MAG: TonB-dependent hemoglobin/transferrin/lactoferrin family receptor [Hydrogenophilaceae bacterium]|jgi:hemoglobin/transferrin/lactoferrin receptor protein|nr:TonB-dependent hemoglobin/transferrin/lactoferrin family receptor [Hydrogenophilaceae bacterium]
MRKWTATAAMVTALSAACGVAEAQEAPDQEGLSGGDAAPITIIATRLARSAEAAPSTVTVITDEDIEAQLATDIKDLVRFEPGVAVRAAPARFTAALAATGRDGNAGFNIRGLEGNRVLFLVDGVRVPDGFSFGPAAFGRGDYVDLDLLRSVEILRGPSSALYGSDGLAGAVSFTTKDPDDLLYADEDFMARVRVGYASADESWAEGLSAAGRWGDWQGLLVYTRRDGHETDNQGENDAANASRTAPNPQDISSNAALARIVYAPNAGNRFRLTADYGDREIVTEGLTGRSIPPLGATSVIDLDGLDESERWRVAFDHRFTGAGPFEGGHWSVYYQESALSQFSDEDRNTAADRTRLTTFDNSVWGASLQLESAFANHRLVYGGDYSSTRQEGVRDGTTPPAGESFPVRAFPNTDYVLAGAFVQDEISLLDGTLNLYPALRYDYYDLSPEADALYPAPALGQSDERVTAKFGAVAWPTDHFGAFFTFSEGFKAPSPSQVNNFFANPLFGYTSIPNPDLGPETSESFEVGVRLRDVALFGGAWRGSLAAFAADYEDFISQQVVGGTGAPGDPLIFQFVNLSAASISGLEARAEGRWENGLGLILAASIAEGEQTTLGATTPLNSVEPLKVVAGLSYAHPSGAFGGQFILTHIGEKDAGDVAQTCTNSLGQASPCFIPDSATFLDLNAYWTITDAATLRAGVFNLTDETYWWWSDVRGLDSTNSVLDAYTQPGRNVSVSLAYRF